MNSIRSIQQSLQSWLQDQPAAVQRDFQETEKLPRYIESWFNGDFMYGGPIRPIRYVSSSVHDWDTLRKTLRFVSTFSPPSRYSKLFRFQVLHKNPSQGRLPSTQLLRDVTLSFPKPVQSFTSNKEVMVAFALDEADFDEGDIGGFISLTTDYQNLLADSPGVYAFLKAIVTDKSLGLSRGTREAFKDALHSVEEFLSQDEVIVDCSASLRGDIVLKEFDQSPRLAWEMIKTVKPLIAKL